jgi:hypothetical protein
MKYMGECPLTRIFFPTELLVPVILTDTRAWHLLRQLNLYNWSIAAMQRWSRLTGLWRPHSGYSSSSSVQVSNLQIWSDPEIILAVLGPRISMYLERLGQDPDPDTDPLFHHIKSKKNLDSHCFVTSIWKWCTVNVPSKSNMQKIFLPDSLGHWRK